MIELNNLTEQDEDDTLAVKDSKEIILTGKELNTLDLVSTERISLTR